MSVETTIISDTDQSRIGAGRTLKQAAAICEANKDALIARCKQKQTALSDTNESAKTFVDLVVVVLKVAGNQLHPKVKSATHAVPAEMRPVEREAMVRRSGRALQNAASLLKANHDTFASLLDHENFAGPAFLELTVDVLNSYGVYLRYDDNVKEFKTEGNPFFVSIPYVAR